MQRYVLDTNVLVASISNRSPHHWIWISLTQKKDFILCVTTDILEEYEEILQRFYGQNTANTVMDALLNLSNIEFITRYYCWNLITSDPDDNKFVDCGIASQSKFIVSEDKYFNVLKKETYKMITAIKISEFKVIIGI